MLLCIDLWQAVYFKTGYAPVSYGKQKTVEIPRELRRRDVERKSTWVSEKYITTQFFNIFQSGTRPPQGKK